MEKVKLFMVDDHPLVLEGFRSLLEQVAHIDLVGTATTAAEALSFLESNRVDISFLDINLPDMSGIDLCKKIIETYPHIKCIALSTFTERSYISRMIQNGAMGYLLKSSTKEEILQAITQVQNGGYFMNVNLNLQTSEPPKTSRILTRREIEILKLIAEGLTNPQIAEKLFLSPLTVNTHRKSLLMKFEVSNTAALVKQAMQLDLL